jgi:hypothetical protein
VSAGQTQQSRSQDQDMCRSVLDLRKNHHYGSANMIVKKKKKKQRKKGKRKKNFRIQICTIAKVKEHRSAIE